MATVAKASRRGGSKPGERRGGRKKGQPNKRTQEFQARVQEAAKAIESALPQAFQGDAHAFMMTIYKDPAQPVALRLDAAKAAAQYETPALARIESRNEHAIINTVASEPLTKDEWESKYTTEH